MTHLLKQEDMTFYEFTNLLITNSKLSHPCREKAEDPLSKSIHEIIKNKEEMLQADAYQAVDGDEIDEIFAKAVNRGSC